MKLLIDSVHSGWRYPRILIPPSVILVIYGLLTETSIGKLFIAGIVSGFLGIVLYMGAVAYTGARNLKPVRLEFAPAGLSA